MADLTVRYGVGVRRACQATGFPRSTHHYRARREPQAPPRQRLRESATSRVRYGYRRLHALLRREGWAVNLKRGYRLYRLERLTLRRKNPRRRVSSRHRDDRPAVEAADQTWAMDFLSDALADGRKLRMLAVIDLFTRECPAIRVATRFTSGQVAEVMAEVASGRGVPREVRVDNGPEFAGRMLDLWAHLKGVTPDFSRPGKPTDNGFIESFNGRLREECLNQCDFTGLEDARERLEAWRVESDERRPHSALGYLTPEKFAASQAGKIGASSDRKALTLKPLLTRSLELGLGWPLIIREAAMSRCKKDPLRDLTEPERQELVELSRSQSAPAAEVIRARILLADAAGDD